MAIRRAPRPVKPSTRVERAHWSSGCAVVVGADAVGVASLSGPVVAAAVAWPPLARRIPGVRDSKVLSRVQRERLFPLIRRRARSVGIGAASVAEIDRLNIYHATNLAMRRAICRIGERDHVLIDGLRVRHFEESVGPYTAIVRGDARCYSIAAASIVAKVVRDRLMERLARRYPQYGWEHNAGYATLDHRRGIEEHGITAFHRRSFARVRAVALGEQMALDLDLAGLEEIDEMDEFHELAPASEPALSGNSLISRQ
jgi:ribonuclease HII